MVICFCYFSQLSLLTTGSEKYSFVVVALGTLQQYFEIENFSLFNFFQMKSLYQFIVSTSYLEEPPFSQFPPQVNTQSCTSNKVSTQSFNRPAVYEFDVLLLNLQYVSTAALFTSFEDQ